MDDAAASPEHHDDETGLRMVKFGSVTVTVRPPTEAEMERNIEKGREALARSLKRLLCPGFRLYPKRGVPYFWADEEHPGKFVRLLDGKHEVGVLEDGEFKVTG